MPSTLQLRGTSVLPRLGCAVGELSRTRSRPVNSRFADPSVFGPRFGIIRVVEWVRVVTNILVGTVIRRLAVRSFRKLLHGERRVQRSFTGRILTMRIVSERGCSFGSAATTYVDNGPNNECQTNQTSDHATCNSTFIA